MIYRDRSQVERPEFLDSDEVRKELLRMAEFYLRPFEERAQETYSHNPALLQHAEILKPLLQLFHNKCAFCESRISLEAGKDGSSQAVVHRFRPLSHATDYGWNLEPKEWPDHYWWLAYTWENLYPACRECDESRGNYFPLMPLCPRAEYLISSPEERKMLREYIHEQGDEQIRRMAADIDPSREMQRILDSIRWLPIDNERDCLLDPCRDLKEPGTDQDLWDGKYIVFLQDAFAISSSQFDADRIDNRADPAGNSIALYGLNRSTLHRERYSFNHTDGKPGHKASIWMTDDAIVNADILDFRTTNTKPHQIFLGSFVQMANRMVNRLVIPAIQPMSKQELFIQIEERLNAMSSVSAWLGNLTSRRVIENSSHSGDSNLLHVASQSRRIRRISPAGSSLYSNLGFRPDLLEQFDFSAGQLANTYATGPVILHFSISDNSSLIAIASEDGIVRIWRSGQSDPFRTLTHVDSVLSARLSPDESRVLSVCSGLAWLWDLQSGQVLRTFQDENQIDDAQFVGDGSRVLLSGTGMPPVIRDVASGENLQIFMASGSTATPAISSDGRRMLTVNSEIAFCFETDEGRHSWQLSHDDIITSAAFCPPGEFEGLVATSSQDGTIRISDPDGNYMFHMEHDGTLTDVAFSADGTKLHLTGRGRVVRIIDMAWLRQQRLPAETQGSGSAPRTIDREQQQQQQQQQMAEPPLMQGTTETEQNILSLKLQNFRSIPEMEIDFSPRSNPPEGSGETSWARMKILLGENGLGKSSILWALAIVLMGREQFERLSAQQRYKLRGKHLLRRGTDQGSITLTLSGNEPEPRVVSFRRDSEDPREVRVSFNTAAQRMSGTYLCAYATSRLMNEQEGSKDEFDVGKALREGISWLHSLDGFMFGSVMISLLTRIWKLELPELADTQHIAANDNFGKDGDDIYYVENGVRGSFAQLPEPRRTLTALALDVMQDRRPNLGYSGWDDRINIAHLFDPHSRLTNPDEWLQEQAGEKIAVGGSTQGSTTGFNAAASVISRLLVFEQLLDLLEAEPDDSGERLGQMSIEEDRVQVRSSGGLTELANLSDGYKSVISLGCDILAGAVRHARSGRGTLHTQLSELRGIALIDEIGNNLHPRWKMRIIEKLRLALPRMQFIVTTHEPLCLRGAGAGEVEVIYNAAQNAGEQAVARREDVPDPSELTIDQLLTSPYFGLNSVIDPRREESMHAYYLELRQLKLRQPGAAEGEAAPGSLTDAQFHAKVEELRREHGLTTALSGRSWREHMALHYLDKYLADRPGSTQLDDETKARLQSIWNLSGRLGED
ncbi:AAA family ATPase [bacterium]|nr:AAA family ATPase [bacterium]